MRVRLTRSVHTSPAARRLVRAMLLAKLMEISWRDEIAVAASVVDYMRENLPEVIGGRVS